MRVELHADERIGDVRGWFMMIVGRRQINAIRWAIDRDGVPQAGSGATFGRDELRPNVVSRLLVERREIAAERATRDFV